MRDLWFEKLNILQLEKDNKTCLQLTVPGNLLFFLPNFAEVETNFSFAGVNTADRDLIQ